jgi:hypothetical protein
MKSDWKVGDRAYVGTTLYVIAEIQGDRCKAFAENEPRKGNLEFPLAALEPEVRSVPSAANIRPPRLGPWYSPGARH